MGIGRPPRLATKVNNYVLLITIIDKNKCCVKHCKSSAWVLQVYGSDSRMIIYLDRTYKGKLNISEAMV